MPSPFYLFAGASRTKIPPELTSKSELLKYLGVSTAELKRIWWFRGRMYSHFNISKHSGKSRLISAPDYRLKMLQQKITRSLAKLYNPRKPVHGFVTDRSVRSNAESHLRRRFILNVDLKNFFTTITEPRVQGLLESIGIDKEVAETVARPVCADRSCDFCDRLGSNQTWIWKDALRSLICRVFVRKWRLSGHHFFGK